MIPWQRLDQVSIPNQGGKLNLYRRDKEYSIRVDNYELMNSRVHGSEEILAEQTCARVGRRPEPRILIGGLGMGFTLMATLKTCVPEAEIIVAELIPTVIEWNKNYLGELNEYALKDKRTTILELDVARLLRDPEQRFDAILLDVDNGPNAMTQKRNNWLYTLPGLQAAHDSLTSRGVLGVWSTEPDRAFGKRLRTIGFKMKELSVRARRNKGAHHTIWLAEKVASKKKRIHTKPSFS